MGKILYVDGLAFLFWAILLLLVPASWLLAALAAALVHEGCHVLAVYLLGGTVVSIKIGPFGASIEACGLDFWGECISVLSGPCGSLGLVLVSRWMPLVALCGLVQGIYNLIPIYPLDGGRILRILGTAARI